MLQLRSLACALTVLGLCAGIGLSRFQPPADEPQSLNSFQKLKPPTKDEPLAKEFSLAKAGRALDSASAAWWKGSKCFTCHTNVSYFYGRALAPINDPAHGEIRKTLEESVATSFKGKRKLSDFYAVSQATSLAIDDANTTKKLHPLTKEALDHMWTQQLKDGHMPWGGGGHPIGSLHYGAAITVVAVAVAPDGYIKTEAAQNGLKRLLSWYEKNPPRSYYDKAMTLWAASHLEGILTAEQKKTIIEELRGKQQADGGWSLPTFGNEKQQKGTEGNTGSDGYATGLTVYALRQAGVPANDPAIVKGIAWLKANQLESGRWPTRSLNNGVGQVLTNTAQAFVVMALHSCGEATR